MYDNLMEERELVKGGCIGDWGHGGRTGGVGGREVNILYLMLGGQQEEKDLKKVIYIAVFDIGLSTRSVCLRLWSDGRTKTLPINFL